jgi:beta-glucosidase-like glycosyl hydrolase
MSKPRSAHGAPRRRLTHRIVPAGLALIVAATLAGGPAGAAQRAAATVTAAALNPGAASAAFKAMTEAQRVGQLFMVGTPATGLSSQTVTDIQTYHVGNVILTGRSSAGVAATAAVSAAAQAKANGPATAGVPLFISTDQEGGQVQVLSGTGFSTIPSGLTQGGYAPSTLRADAKTWGTQLKSAGVNVNLAPVLDTVPSAAFAPQNKPIGYYQREYGFDPATVSTEGNSFAQGMADAGIAATVKHFPGLGRVTANTDTSSGVTDTQTTRYDAYVQPYADAVNQGVPIIMVSLAYYSKIDPNNPAAFSSTVINGMIRADLGFTGVVMSDSLGATQVSPWALADRALNFFAAGGDLALINDPSLLPAMYNAVLNKANTDSAFKSQVDASAMRVLTAKQNRGLLSQGMDVSSAQGSVDWQAAFNLGARFAYVKATEGTSYTNPSFAQQYNGSYNIGMIRGAYHYAHPDSSTGTAQADYFVGHGGGWSGDGRTMPPALVLQPGTSATCYGLSATGMVNWVKAFSDEMHLKTNKYPLIYTTFGWWNTCTANSAAFATTNPFWLASYTSTPPASIPAGTATWTLWQSASSGTFPGGQDQFNGPYSQLLALATNAD